MAFASGIDHPPPRAADSKGIRNWFTGRVMRRAGAGVALDWGRALLVTDDVGSTTWRVMARP